MAKAAAKRRTKAEPVVARLLERFGQTFAQELNIRLEQDSATAWFKLLVFALLSSTRIGHRIAVDATRALFDKGWTSARKMVAATWRQRTDTLNRAGYARYDESTSRYLGDTCEVLLERYSGDLRRLRDEADRDPSRERALLKQCKGVGDVGCDIFFREAQAAWTELFPFADKKALKAARRLRLGDNAESLRRHARSRRDYCRLVAALVRCELEDGYRDVLQVATSRRKT